jgi:5,10-methenyltetrahydrofolate synthetase
MTKQELRAALKKRRAEIPTDERREMDGRIVANLAASELFQNASALLVYAPLDGEINLLPLVRIARERGIPVAFPRCDVETNTMRFYCLLPTARLTEGAYRIPEPPDDAPLCEPDARALCILPALSFDPRGARIGYGKGYYDRYLATFPGIRVGAVYSKMILKTVPAEPHDLPVSFLVTERGIRACSAAAPEVPPKPITPSSPSTEAPRKDETPTPHEAADRETEKTGGAVNIAMGSVLSIWHDCRELGMDDPASAKLPSMERLQEAALHTDIRGLIIDEEACTVTLTDPAMRLDVGAIAKGYAVEAVARSLEEKGIRGYVINVGGNVRTVGTKPEGEPWLVGIENPAEDSQEPYLAYLNLVDRSLVTSGSYQRYYVVNGERYHHIIDPETLMPAQGYLSVSVVCESSADGDALSTALFCMSPEEGMALIESLPGIEAMWVTSDGVRKYSSGFFEYVPLPTE